MFTSIQFTYFHALGSELKADCARKVSDLTVGSGDLRPQMLPLTPVDVLLRRVGVAALVDDQLAGYIGAQDPVVHESSQMTEVGSLVVAPAFRRRHIASALVAALTWHVKLAGETPYVFCNPSSIRIFERAGYSAACAKEIPRQAFGLCTNCPARPSEGGCCDATLIFGHGL